MGQMYKYLQDVCTHTGYCINIYFSNNVVTSFPLFVLLYRKDIPNTSSVCDLKKINTESGSHETYKLIASHIIEKFYYEYVFNMWLFSATWLPYLESWCCFLRSVHLLPQECRVVPSKERPAQQERCLSKRKQKYVMSDQYSLSYCSEHCFPNASTPLCVQPQPAHT